MFQALSSSLDPSKAEGCDKIGQKLCALALYQLLHHLFCLSLHQAYVPAEWRMHFTTPIFKAGDKSLVINYRPTSLLCVVSKVLERLIYKHLLDFVMNLFSSVQFLLCSSCLFFSLTGIHKLMLFILISKKPLIVWLTMNYCSNCGPMALTGNTWRWLQSAKGTNVYTFAHA